VFDLTFNIQENTIIICFLEKNHTHVLLECFGQFIIVLDNTIVGFILGSGQFLLKVPKL